MPTFPALFGLHFHACRLFDTDRATKSSGWGAVFDSRATTELLTGIHSVGDAVDALRDEPDEKVRHHAVAVLARGLQNARRLGNGSPEGLESELFEEGIRALVPGKAAAVLRSIATRGGEDALVLAYRALENDPSFDYKVHTSRVDRGVSEFSVEVTRKARGKPLDYFVQLTDPTRWAETAPETFAASYRTAPRAARGAPLDPFGADPAEEESTASAGAGGTYVGSLFENAKLPLFASFNVTEFRNILNIDFEVDRAKSRIALTYSLYQSLTSKVLGMLHQGGIDVDSGEGSVHLDRRADRVTFRAGKNIRFTSAAPFHTELNVMALPFLWYWITSLTLVKL
jgi:hypothetical protein